MAEADNDIAFLLVPKQSGHLLCHRIGVKVLDGLEILVCNKPLRLYAQSENADLKPATTDDGIGADYSFERSAFDLVVGADNGEMRHAKDCCQGIKAVVKLVVAERGGIVAHTVERIHFYTPVEEVEIGRALAEVAGIKQKQIRVLLALLLDKTHTAGITAQAVGLRLYLRVGVVGMKNGERGGFLLAAREKHKSRKNIDKSFHIG